MHTQQNVERKNLLSNPSNSFYVSSTISFTIAYNTPTPSFPFKTQIFWPTKPYLPIKQEDDIQYTKISKQLNSSSVTNLQFP